jgi:type IV pilus assembly protein PilM
MLNIFSDHKSPLGLDISDISVKLIQFYRLDGKKNVQAYSDYTMSKAIFSGDKIQDPNALVKTIRSAIASPKFGKVTTKQVVASIPETKSFVRVIQMPALSEAEAVEAVPWEAEAYIPLPISQVYLDWVVLSPTLPSLDLGGEAQTSGKKMTVLITAAPKDYVDSLVKVLKDAGLQPVALEVESQATARSLMSKTQEAVLIVDIDTVRTSLIISDHGTLQFTSSFAIAGDVFTDAIAKSLGIDREVAERLKREVGIDEEAEHGTVKQALRSPLNNLIEEIKNTIRFFEEHSSGSSKISRLVLCGGSSKLKHLPSFLHQKLSHQTDNAHPLRSLLDLKIELGNPWANVLAKGQTPPLSRDDSLSFATAIGLGLREID